MIHDRNFEVHQMLVKNSPYYTVNRNNRLVPKLQLERSPSLFDYIRGNVGLVHKISEEKASTESLSHNTEDVLIISDETLTKLRNEYIEKSLESGEPMEGVTYDDFVQYYRDKQGFCWGDDYMHRLYSQTQKGWKASCAEHEWQTNPNFIMTTPMFGSPELTEDREKAFEKLKSGSELTKLENDLLSTFPNTQDGIERVNAVVQEHGRTAYKQYLLDKMASSGVELTSNDEITFTVWGYDIIDVKGTVDDEKLAAIKEAMKDSAYSLDSIYSAKYNRKTMSKGTRFQLDQFKKAQHYLDLAGGGSLLDLSKDSNGDYHGIPEQLSKFLSENKHYHGDDKSGLQAIWVRNAFDEAIAAIESGRYDWFKSKVGIVTFKNGEFYA